MLTAEFNGIRLAYAETGRGPDIVFVHGIPSDYRAWDNQVAVFSKQYHMVAYSRRHAQPNNNPGSLRDSTIENNARDLEGLIRKTTHPPINLVGHSYGGFTAAVLASAKPELVRRLVLIEPGITTLLIQNPESRAQMFSFLLRSPSVALAAGKYIRQYYNPLLKAYDSGDLDTALNYFLDGLMNRKGSLGQMAQNLQVMVKENAKTIGEVEAKLPPFTTKDAQQISSPTLLINGSDGTKIFRAINERLAKSIPNSELATIPNSSHFPHLENSEGFNHKVIEFLSGS